MISIDDSPAPSWNEYSWRNQPSCTGVIFGFVSMVIVSVGVIAPIPFLVLVHES